jgi:hypothetical protein
MVIAATAAAAAAMLAAVVMIAPAAMIVAAVVTVVAAADRSLETPLTRRCCRNSSDSQGRDSILSWWQGLTVTAGAI